MPKLKDMLSEVMQFKLGQVRTDKDFPPFAKNEAAWKKQWDKKLNEELMPMDKRFAKDWEKSCKALLNHMANNYDDLTKTGKRMELKKTYKWLVGAMRDIEKVTGHAARMAKAFGTD